MFSVGHWPRLVISKNGESQEIDISPFFFALSGNGFKPQAPSCTEFHKIVVISLNVQTASLRTKA